MYWQRDYTQYSEANLDAQKDLDIKTILAKELSKDIIPKQETSAI